MATSDISEADLFSNPALKQQFEKLSPEEQAAYKQSGEYMYSRDFQNVTETSCTDNAVAYIKRAFDSGMLPSQLTSEELTFLRLIYGPTWYHIFGFESETYSGSSEKKTNRNKKQARSINPDPLIFTKAIIAIKDEQLSKLTSQTPLTTFTPPRTEYTRIPVQPEYEYTKQPSEPAYIDSSTFIGQNEGEDESNRDSSYIYKVWS